MAKRKMGRRPGSLYSAEAIRLKAKACRDVAKMLADSADALEEAGGADAVVLAINIKTLDEALGTISGLAATAQTKAIARDFALAPTDNSS